MPTLLILYGFKFLFYANDHPPPHVHIVKGNTWAKVELLTLEVKYSSFKSNELKTVLKILKEHQSSFLEKWHDWFSGSRNSF